MKKYYLAVDIGASSGRHVLGYMDGGKMILEEIHRFSNGMKQIQRESEKQDIKERPIELCWDVEELFREILFGMKKCKEVGKIPVSMGIDTWAVDFVLLDKSNKRIGNAVAYRDNRTKGMDEAVYQLIPENELYGYTGIQKQMFNTIYQLMALKKNNPQQLAQAESMLMIPEYFNFLLTGKKCSEYTNTTTTQLVNAKTKNWDKNIIEKLGYKKEIFQEIQMPGTILGNLKKSIEQEVGFRCKVVLPATHDTASAVMAIPTNQENTIYLSSGTWSLMGCERSEEDCSLESKQHNFTNEGGYAYRFRYLKNIMGLWMIQSVKKELAPEQSFDEICKKAAKVNITSLVNCNDERFLSPENMTVEVMQACEESGQKIPEGIEEVASVIYNSLAKCYADTVAEIEEMTGKKYDSIYIVGGGANATYLNELTAKATKCTIYAGPTEATAIGNLAAQFIAGEEVANLKEIRDCIFNSFEIAVYN